MNDIHRNFNSMNQKGGERERRRQDEFADDAGEYKDDYEEGDVTGFMVQNPLPNSGMNSLSVSSGFV